MIEVKLEGDWAKLKELLHNLPKEMQEGMRQGMMQAGLQGENIAKKAIQAQAPPDNEPAWKELHPDYKVRKIKEGYSEKIYVRTSTLLQSITTWAGKSGSGTRVYFGIRRSVKAKGGAYVFNIAAKMEYGSKADPTQARPLFRPTRRALLKWMLTSKVIQNAILKRLEKYR